MELTSGIAAVTLNNCPQCGKSRVGEFTLNKSMSVWAVRCRDCNAQTNWWKRADDAGADWNKGNASVPMTSPLETTPTQDKPASTSSEAVNHPAHYGGADDPYEAIKVIEAWGLGFCLGNCVKYLSRAGKKGSRLVDLQKALWYLRREIANAEKAGTWSGDETDEQVRAALEELS